MGDAVMIRDQHIQHCKECGVELLKTRTSSAFGFKCFTCKQKYHRIKALEHKHNKHALQKQKTNEVSIRQETSDSKEVGG